jgi:hypothetical protein
MKALSREFPVTGYRLAGLVLATVLVTATAGQLDWRQLLGSSRDQYSLLWEEFCDELKKSGSAIEFYSPDDDELDRAEGYRFLSRILRLSLLSELEHYDAERPVIWQSETSTRKFGGNNPDELYFDAFIDGAKSYRVSGQRGTTPLIEMTVYAGRLRSGESGKHVAHLTEQDLQVAEDGSFQVILSPEPQAGNWIRTTPETNFLYIRQYRFNWEEDRPAELKIEMLQSVGPPAPLTLEHLRERLMATARSVEHNASFWPKLTQLAAMRGKNRIFDPIIPGRDNEELESEDVTLPQGHILQPGYFDLEEDEALLIRFTPPKGLAYWGFCLLNRWYENLDYRYFDVHSNSFRASAGENGEVQLIVSEKDPGLPNWIATAGHRQGTMLFRWTRPTPSTELPTIFVEKVALADLELAP